MFVPYFHFSDVHFLALIQVGQLNGGLEAAATEGDPSAVQVDVVVFASLLVFFPRKVFSEW